MVMFGSGMSNVLRAAAAFEASLAEARVIVGQETTDRCLEWARTTILPNHHAFDICWKAGGPEQAEQSLIYLDLEWDMQRRLARHGGSW